MRARRLLVLTLCLLAACRARGDRAVYEGEWTVRLRVESMGTRAPSGIREVEGTMVIDRRVPDFYAIPEMGPGFPYVAGRAYVSLRSFLAPRPGMPAPGTPSAFDPSPMADEIEEVVAGIDSAGDFRAFVAPHVTHVGFQARGRLRGDTIRGTWDGLQYGRDPGIRGTFVMVRRRATALTDSALRRSRRAERFWRTDSALISTQADTTVVPEP